MITENKVTEMFCISDDYCKEYALEWNKNPLSTSFPNSSKRGKRRGRMGDVGVITILVLFCCNTF
ncbi:hypothetical protein GCWU000325_02320 [Alloprevotella tannerae ATCC 51259]|uniref:Uncharacterized protein n=1 Tax=Alloprevotella tannerae ATCC 51259 TaxID=626522 RepID=C9LJA8_9BACT|nr:hypothetical protein GCWU000325_02320 [Alloprevotella tannerae ATCC 51259]